MSIYLAKKELIDILNKSKLEYKIESDTGRNIAIDKNGKYMTFSEYSEENLKKLVINRKNIFVDIEFWNYNYCSGNNLDPYIVDEFIEKLSVAVNSLTDFSTGTLVVLIILHEILLNTFKIKSNELYLEYLSNIKISKKIIRNFMISMEYQLPLTENYLSLILEVFDDETIYDFIFRDCCNFTLGEFSKIMEFFKLRDINMASYYICDKFKDNKVVLSYLEKCIELFEGRIDVSEQIVYSKKNNEHYIGYCLMTMKLNTELEPLYYSVIKKYMDKEGSIKIIVSDSKKDSTFIERRRKEILNYFDKF